MAHLTPVALHFTDTIPSNINDLTHDCSDFFKTQPPSKWLAEEYIKVDSSFDTYLATLKRLGCRKSSISTYCYRLYQHYLSSTGQAQLTLLKQRTSIILSKEIAKGSTHQTIYNEIHTDNTRTPRRMMHTHLGLEAQGALIPELVQAGQKHSLDDYVDDNDATTKSPRNLVEDEDEDGEEDDVILVKCGGMSARPTSIHRASRGSRTHVPGQFHTLPSSSLTHSKLPPKIGTLSTVSSRMYQKSTPLDRQIDSTTQSSEQEQTSTLSVRNNKNFRSANSRAPARRAEQAKFESAVDSAESDTAAEDAEVEFYGGQKQTRIEQDGGEGIRTPIKRSHESVNPFRRKQQKCPIAGNLNALTPPKPRAPSLDGSDSESDIVIPRVSPAPFSVASTAQKAPGGNGDDEFPDPTLNLAQYEVLNQATTWVCNGVDLIPRFRDFRAGNLGPFSLVRDGIADMTHGSSFAMTLPSNALSEARKVASTPDVDAKWPTLQGIADRVFRNNTYDEIAQAVRKENMEDPVAAYLFSIVMAYFHYFRFHAEIPGDLNEREGFTDLTWSFIRGALTMTNIESRHLEVLITGAQERKNHSRNPFFDIMETGHYCDGLAFSGKDQIFLAEASQIQNAKADKMCQDQYKLARALRDSWLSQLKSICREAVPPRDFAVFGSCTYKDETRLLQLDFQGTFRLCQFDSFLIPLKRNEFGRRMSLAVQSCLKLALRIEQEISKRNLAAPASFDTQQQLSDALSRTIVTTATPTKPRKKKSI